MFSGAFGADAVGELHFGMVGHEAFHFVPVAFVVADFFAMGADWEESGDLFDAFFEVNGGIGESSDDIHGGREDDESAGEHGENEFDPDDGIEDEFLVLGHDGHGGVEDEEAEQNGAHQVGADGDHAGAESEEETGECEEGHGPGVRAAAGSGDFEGVHAGDEEETDEAETADDVAEAGNAEGNHDGEVDDQDEEIGGSNE